MAPVMFPCIQQRIPQSLPSLPDKVRVVLRQRVIAFRLNGSKLFCQGMYLQRQILPSHGIQKVKPDRKFVPEPRMHAAAQKLLALTAPHLRRIIRYQAEGFLRKQPQPLSEVF